LEQDLDDFADYPDFVFFADFKHRLSSKPVLH